MELFKGSFSSAQPFSKQTVSVPLPDEVNYGQRAQFVLPRMGDVISNITLSFTLPELTRAPKDTIESSEPMIDWHGRVHIWRPGVDMDYEQDHFIDTIIFPTSSDPPESLPSFANFHGSVTLEEGQTWRVGEFDYTLDNTLIPTAKVENNYKTQGYSDSISNAMLEEASLLIGGQTVQVLNGEILEILNDLTLPFSMDETLSKTQGRVYNPMGMTPAATNPQSSNFDVVQPPDFEPFPRRFYVPLRFFFHNKPGASLPHTLLTHHEVEVALKFRSLKYASSITTDVAKPAQLRLFVDYVTLSPPERAAMTAAPPELVIPQYQLNAFELAPTTGEQNVRLTFKHPVKELILVFQDMNTVETPGGPPRLFEYEDILESLSVRLNDWEKLPHEVGSGDYLHSVVPMNHHTASPRRNVYTYSFTLRPEEDDASGSINFSRVLNPSLSIRLKDVIGLESKNIYMRVYAVSLNVLVFGQGMGSLYFS